jgi:transforming growth factor-beta-induced protein
MKVLSALLPLLLSSFVSGQTEETIPEVIAVDATLSALTAAFAGASAGVEVFFTGVNVTMFAPTNDAFAALDPALLSKYLEPAWSIHLTYLLSNHLLLNQLAYASTVVDGSQVNSVLSEYLLGYDPWTLTVNTTGIFVSGLAFNMSQVIEADIVAVDGLVHKVDKVFLPAALFTSLYDLMAATGEYTILLSALDSTGLASVVKTETMTLLAPLDEFLVSLPPDVLAAYNLTEVLLNHVILGDPVPSESLLVEGFSFTTALGITYTATDVNGTLFFGDAFVVDSDYAGSNGIYHGIRGLLLPPVSSSNTTAPPGMVSSDPPMINATEPPGMVSSDPPMITEPPGMVSSDPPMITEPPVASPTVASSAASLSSIALVVLMLLTSFTSMMFP